jgi:FeS assembly SUF system protein
MSKKKLIIKDIDQAIKNLKKNDTKDNESKDKELKIMSKKELIIEEISKIYDPEIPVNIYALGLIYEVIVKNEESAKIKMTLTSPNCPVAETLPQEVKDSAMQVEGIQNVDLELVWDPPWNKDMMSEAAKLELNL